LQSPSIGLSSGIPHVECAGSRYKGKHIGTYAADLVVDGRLLVEIKCADQLGNEHLAQCINYLKASGLHLALLINFRKSRVEWRRVVHNL